MRLFPQPTIIGHRGIAGEAPENTVVGFHQAAALGCQWVEFDVQLTADGVPVVFHDPQLTRTAGLTKAVNQVALAELKTLEVGSWFDSCYQGEPIPTLVEVIDTLVTLNLSANLEIKTLPGHEIAITDTIIACLDAHWPSSQPIVLSSFSMSVMQHLTHVAPHYPRACLFNQWVDDWQQQLEHYHSVGMHVHYQALTQARCQLVSQRDYYLLAYTVNQVEPATQLITWGVNAICSDHPQRLLAAL